MLSSHIARVARTVVPTGTLQFSRILVQCVVIATFSLLMLCLSSLNTSDYRETTKISKNRDNSQHRGMIQKFAEGAQIRESCDCRENCTTLLIKPTFINTKKSLITYMYRVHQNVTMY